MITKEWKNIEGYEKFYKVSNYGEVKAKRRVVYNMIDGELQPISVTPEHLITPTDNGNGYKIVGLIGEDKKKKTIMCIGLSQQHLYLIRITTRK